MPSADGIFLTSNRDEKRERPDAVYPAIHHLSSGRLLYPKDAQAGGTWIAVHENGNAIVFLNGGVFKHIPQPPYRKSRGLVLLDILNTDRPLNSFESMDLHGIEPFTAVIWDAGDLCECRWDGNEKYVKQRNPTIPHIWSSVTLYTDEVIAKRQQWFENWIAGNPLPGMDEIMNFHRFTGDGDQHNDLTMNRDGETFTVSITSIALHAGTASIRYLDLKKGLTASQTFVLETDTGILK